MTDNRVVVLIAAAIDTDGECLSMTRRFRYDHWVRLPDEVQEQQRDALTASLIREAEVRGIELIGDPTLSEHEESA